MYSQKSFFFLFWSFRNKNPRVVISKVQNCDLEVSRFELQTRYYIHFRTNTLDKVMNPIIIWVK